MMAHAVQCREVCEQTVSSIRRALAPRCDNQHLMSTQGEVELQPPSARRRPHAVVPLADLVGPRSGVISLPGHVDWSGTSQRFDLSEPRRRRLAYERLLREGLSDDLRRLVNRERLVDDFPHLYLPDHIREAWATLLSGAGLPAA